MEIAYIPCLLIQSGDEARANRIDWTGLARRCYRLNDGVQDQL